MQRRTCYDTDLAIRYKLPERWIAYDREVVFQPLVEAKAVIGTLKATPYQRDWVDELQALQLKMEVAGTSRIEGAEFTEPELEDALEPGARELLTRSQRQARAAAQVYRWIATIPDDRPIDAALICEIHTRMVRGCDDDHCEPGRPRGEGDNVTFGIPRHRGVEGGKACLEALTALVQAINREFRDHDPLLRAIALHYHFAAMHPFQDGNGRTARALEALMLQRTGLRDTAFIAMSNYYHEEKIQYLETLTAVRAANHDLTAFAAFALRGVAVQCERLLRDIKIGIKKAMFRNTMFDLFQRLESPRKRVIAERQLAILKVLLNAQGQKLTLAEVLQRTKPAYAALNSGGRAQIRDLNGLLALGALQIERSKESVLALHLNLDWPAQITESEFAARVKDLPKAKTHPFLQG
jgi:Fic family protein